ncbi:MULTISPECIES: hypothetical protein [Chryseobacterium]|nr:hypothetical protein [Chryseobacterium sp. R2A-55]
MAYLKKNLADGGYRGEIIEQPEIKIGYSINEVIKRNLLLIPF